MKDSKRAEKLLKRAAKIAAIEAEIDALKVELGKHSQQKEAIRKIGKESRANKDVDAEGGTEKS